MDEERMSFHRQKIFKESARFTNAKNMCDNYSNKNKNKNKNISSNKVIGYKYCCRTRRTDSTYLDEKQKSHP